MNVEAAMPREGQHHRGQDETIGGHDHEIGAQASSAPGVRACGAMGALLPVGPLQAPGFTGLAVSYGPPGGAVGLAPTRRPGHSGLEGRRAGLRRRPAYRQRPHARGEGSPRQTAFAFL